MGFMSLKKKYKADTGKDAPPSWTKGRLINEIRGTSAVAPAPAAAPSPAPAPPAPAIGRAVRAEGARNQAAADERFDELGEGQDAIGRAVRAEGARNQAAADEMMSMLDAIYKGLERSRWKRGGHGAAVTELGKGTVTVLTGKKGKLGKGSHGLVRKGQMETDEGQIPVAVKVVDLDDEDARRALQRELKILVGSMGVMHANGLDAKWRPRASCRHR